MNQQINNHKNTFELRYAKWIVKNWWLGLIGALALVFFLFPKGPPEFNNDYQVFFSPENPQLKAFKALQDKYTKDDNVYVVIAPENGKVFDRQVLMAIEELTEHAWQTPYSSRVDAITNFQHTIAEGDDMYVDDLISDISNKTDQEIAAAEKIALAEPLLQKRLINEDGSYTGVNITVKTPSATEWAEIQRERGVIADSLSAQFEALVEKEKERIAAAEEKGEEIEAEVIKLSDADALQIKAATFQSPEEEIASFVRSKVADIEAKYPTVKTHLSGVVMLSNAFGEAATKDIRFVGYMLIIIFVVLLFASRTITGTIVTLLVLIFSMAASVGFTGLVGMKFTAVSMPNAPIMILTLAVADSIHILISFIQSMHKGLPKRDAIIESLRINFMPVFITSATTIVGFLTLNFSDSPPFRDLGNISAVGVAVAFILSVTLLPALLTILPVWIKKREGKKAKQVLINKLADFVIGNSKKILWTSSGALILFLFLAFQNQLNEQFVDYFDESIPFRSDTDLMSEKITGIYTIEYSVSSNEEGGISNPEYLNTLAGFEKWAEAQNGVVHVNTYTDVARKVNKSMHGDDQAYYDIPKVRNEAAQYLLLYEMSLPFGLDLNNQVNVDKSETRFIITVKNITAKELIAMSDSGEKWLSDHNIKGESNLGISTAIMFAHLTQRQIFSMANGGLWAILLISIVLILALRNFRIGLISIIPNVFPIIAAFGVWYFLSGYITSGLAIVFSVSIGIVVDDTVHILSKYLRAKREHDATPEEAIRYSFMTVGRAVIITTLVLTCGFFILGQSSFHMISGMAQLTAITIVCALIIDLLFLPSLLLAIDKSGKKKEMSKK